MKPRILDLFCCAGGAARGYADAGFEVVGVDIEPQPNYPYEFIQADALSILRGMAYWPNFSGEMWRPGYFHAAHASCPCQKKCALTAGTNASRGWGNQNHVDLLPPTRALLDEIGLPYVIEQPDGQAEIRKDLTLCGEMFGLDVIRHRNFELGGWTMPQPVHKPHRGRVRGWRHGVYHDGPYVAAYGSGGGKATVAEMQAAMGIDWTDVREELTEAIPPAYTRHIGERLMAELRRRGLASTVDAEGAESLTPWSRLSETAGQTVGAMSGSGEATTTADGEP